MRRKSFILPAVLLTALLFALFYADRMPDYGIKSRWKKITLDALLSDEVPKIAVKDAATNTNRALFLDTREKSEYDVSHISNAIFVGYKEFDLAVMNSVPKSQPIITYCSIGKRSDEIAKKLLKAGYTNVQNMYGGLFEWVNGGHPVVDTQNRPTQKIHAFNKVWGTWLNRGEKVY